MPRDRPRLRMVAPRIATLDTSAAKVPVRDFLDVYRSREWRRLVAKIIRERGRRCEDPACLTPHGPWGRIVGDHKVELRDGGAPLDPGNVVLRCDPCHNAKTAAARRARVGGR